MTALLVSGSSATDREARFARCRAELAAFDDYEDEEVTVPTASSRAECARVASVFAALTNSPTQPKPCRSNQNEQLREETLQAREEVARAQTELANLRSEYAAQTVELASLRQAAAAQAEAYRCDQRMQCDSPLTERKELERTRGELAECREALRRCAARCQAAEARAENKDAELGTCREELNKRARALAAARSARGATCSQQFESTIKVTADGEREDAARAIETSRLRCALEEVMDERRRLKGRLSKATSLLDAAQAQAAASTAAASLLARKSFHRKATFKRSLKEIALRLDAYCLQVEAQLATNGLDPPSLAPPDLASLYPDLVEERVSKAARPTKEHLPATRISTESVEPRRQRPPDPVAQSVSSTPIALLVGGGNTTQHRRHQKKKKTPWKAASWR